MNLSSWIAQRLEQSSATVVVPGSIPVNFVIVEFFCCQDAMGEKFSFKKMQKKNSNLKKGSIFVHPPPPLTPIEFSLE